MMLNKLKQLFVRLKHNKDGKTLIANFGYLSLLQIASYVFPLITLPYLARVIGVEGFGKIAFAAAIMVWFQTIADWGFNFTATRDVAKNRDNKEKISEIFSNVFWARVFLMLISLIGLSVCVLVIPKFKENANIIMISFLMIPGHILFPDWFFQAMERMKYITILNLLSKILFTIAIFLFIKERQDYILQPLFTSLGYVISGIIAMYYILVKWKIRLQFTSFKLIFRTIRSSSDVFINNLMPNLYNAFSVILLGFVGGGVANGIYDSGVRFTNIFQQFLTILSRAFFPFLARRIDKHKIFAIINIGCSTLLAIALILIAPILVNIFYTNEFVEAVNVIRITSVSLIFLAMNNTYGTNYLLLTNRENKLRNITIISSLIGFSLAFPLIYKEGIIGAALVVTITRGVLGILSMLYVYNIIKKK